MDVSVEDLAAEAGAMALEIRFKDRVIAVQAQRIAELEKASS